LVHWWEWSAPAFLVRPSNELVSSPQYQLSSVITQSCKVEVEEGIHTISAGPFPSWPLCKKKVLGYEDARWYYHLCGHVMMGVQGGSHWRTFTFFSRH
jgi:hypothetical protein